MINIIKEYFTTENEKPVKKIYTIDEEGLKHLSSSLSSYDFYSYNSVDATQFNQDIRYLEGVADTIQDPTVMRNILSRVSVLVGVLSAVTHVTTEHDNG